MDSLWPPPSESGFDFGGFSAARPHAKLAVKIVKIHYHCAVFSALLIFLVVLGGAASGSLPEGMQCKKKTPKTQATTQKEVYSWLSNVLENVGNAQGLSNVRDSQVVS